MVPVREWEEALERDFNHPSIIGWCPFNETWDRNGRQQNDEVIEMVYRTTKLLDTTRPCIDTSGNYHVMTDIYDYHNYSQNPDEFAKIVTDFENEGILRDGLEKRQTYKGEAVFCSEYGGIKWDVENDDTAWGYGDEPKTKEEFIERYKALTTPLLNCKKMMGFCYTQLYDIEQERNGLYTYNREPKFDMEIFREINSQKAAIED